MMQLIEWIDANWRHESITGALEKAHELLPVEQKQIEEAWNNGKRNPPTSNFDNYFYDSESYFKTTHAHE